MSKFHVKKYSLKQEDFFKLINETIVYKKNLSMQSKAIKYGYEDALDYIINDNSELPPPFWAILASSLGYKIENTFGKWREMLDIVNENQGDMTNVDHLWPGYENKGRIAIIQFNKGDADLDKIDNWKEEVNKAFKMFEQNAKKPFSTEQQWFIRFMFSELVTNSLKHGFKNSPNGVAVTASYIDNNDDIHIVIADRGYSIPYNVNRKYPGMEPKDALWWAFEEGNTTKENDELGGKGLYRVKDFIRKIDGEIYVFSGKSISRTSKDKNEFKTNFNLYGGTVIYSKFNLNNINKDIMKIDGNQNIPQKFRSKDE